MITYYKYTIDGYVEDVAPVIGGVISLIAPSIEEQQAIIDFCNISPEVLADALDQDERPRIETDHGCTAVIIRVPWINGNNDKDDFTLPITVIFTHDYIVLVSRQMCNTIETFFMDKCWQEEVCLRGRFLSCLIRSVTERYLFSLKQISRGIKDKEKSLHTLLDNKAFLELLHIQNCLIFFQSALRSNELIVDRVLRAGNAIGDNIKLSIDEHDIDVLDDALTSIRQAISMSEIYAQILQGLMATHSSIVGTNVNMAMKILTSLTLVLMIPTLLTSAYGMNVPLPLQENSWAYVFIFGFSAVVSGVSMYFLWKKGWFSSGV